MPLRIGNFWIQNVFGREIPPKSPLRSGILFANTEVVFAKFRSFQLVFASFESTKIKFINFTTWVLAMRMLPRNDDF